MKKQRINEEPQSRLERYKIPDKSGNGILTNHVVYDKKGNITSYSMAYINHKICAKDDGRVIGYDNKHGKHHRHIMGKYEPVDFISYEDTVKCFNKEWNEFKDEYNEKNNLKIKLGTEEDFFNNALVVARKLDKGEAIEPENIIIFEEPDEMIRFLTPKRREVINAIRVHPQSSITEISQFVHREVSSVSRDINSMAKVGIVQVENVINPGHGKTKRVSLPFKHMTLQVSF